jgi:hypothetical protein
MKIRQAKKIVSRVSEALDVICNDRNGESFLFCLGVVGVWCGYSRDQVSRACNRLAVREEWL